MLKEQTDMSTLDDETHMSEQSKLPAPTNSSTAPPPSLTAPPQRKKAKVDAEAEVDKMLIKSLQEIQDKACERRSQKDDNMDLNFALEIAGRLRRLSPQQNAYVKLQIQQLLFSVEFSQDTVEPTYHQSQYQF